MPRKSTFIPVITGPNFIPMDDIPQDVKEYVEEVYARIRKSDGRERAEYDNEEELKVEMRQIASYCAQRTPPLKFRRSPTRDLPVNVMDFRITADVEANGARKASEKSATK